MKNYYIYELDGEVVCCDCSDMEVWPFFRRIAAELAMADCSGIEIHMIVWNNTEYRYVGWRPGMEFTFENVNDSEDSYTTYMEHLDH